MSSEKLQHEVAELRLILAEWASDIADEGGRLLVSWAADEIQQAREVDRNLANTKHAARRQRLLRWRRYRLRQAVAAGRGLGLLPDEATGLCGVLT